MTTCNDDSVSEMPYTFLYWMARRLQQDGWVYTTCKKCGRAHFIHPLDAQLKSDKPAAQESAAIVVDAMLG